MEHYTISIQRHMIDGGAVFWEAWHPALKGCRAQGETPEAAQAGLDDCRTAYLRGLADSGQPVPPGDTNMKQVLIYVYT